MAKCLVKERKNKEPRGNGSKGGLEDQRLLKILRSQGKGWPYGGGRLAMGYNYGS